MVVSFQHFQTFMSELMIKNANGLCLFVGRDFVLHNSSSIISRHVGGFLFFFFFGGGEGEERIRAFFVFHIVFCYLSSMHVFLLFDPYDELRRLLWSNGLYPFEQRSLLRSFIVT